jgi:hypothetical protein
MHGARCNTTRVLSGSISPKSGFVECQRGLNVSHGDEIPSANTAPLFFLSPPRPLPCTRAQPSCPLPPPHPPSVSFSFLRWPLQWRGERQQQEVKGDGRAHTERNGRRLTHLPAFPFFPPSRAAQLARLLSWHSPQPTSEVGGDGKSERASPLAPLASSSPVLALSSPSTDRRSCGALGSTLCTSLGFPPRMSVRALELNMGLRNAASQQYLTQETFGFAMNCNGASRSPEARSPPRQLSVPPSLGCA